MLEGAEGIGVSKISLNSLRDEDGFGEGFGDSSRTCGWEWTWAIQLRYQGE